MVEMFYNPDPESAVKHQRRSRHLMAEVRDDWGYALATTDLARAVTLIEGYTAARELFEQSLTKWEEMGDNWGIPLSLSAWAEAALRHEPKQAEQNLERALAIQTNVGDRWGEAVTLALWGELRVNRKEFADGEKQLRRSLELHQQLGRKELIADCLECLAVAALGRGSPVRAGFLFGATEKLRKETGVCSPDKRGGHRDADIAASRQAAEQDGTAQDFERQFSLGKNSDIGSACAFALAP